MTQSFPVTRRAIIAGAVGAALSVPMINRGAFAFEGAPAKSYSRRAVDLDGPTFLARDRTPGVEYRGGQIHCPAEIWGV